MAQGTFSSPQFVACIRFMKVTFSQTWRIPLLVFTERSHLHRKFLSVYRLYVCIWRCEGLLKNPLDVFEHLVACCRGTKHVFGPAQCHTSSIASSCYGGDLGFPMGLNQCYTQEFIVLCFLSEAALAAIFIILTNHRMVCYFSNGSWLL